MKLRIEKAVYGGAGLARIGPEVPELTGKTVFVPETLPGELVEATIAEDKRSFANGVLEAVLEPSLERVTPGCEYVPHCGGCQYQHANAAFQVQMKVAILKETLARVHVEIGSNIEAVSGPPWGYRNRIRLHRVPGGGLGYRRRSSHNLMPVSHCPIAAPLLEQAIVAVTNAGMGSLGEEVEFFTNAEQDQLLLSLWPQSPVGEDEIESFAEKLSQLLPTLRGVGLFSGNEVMYWGERSLRYTVGEHAYQVSLGGFFQVNRFLVSQLLDLVVTDGSGQKRTGRLAWDLYSGAGLFARALAYENVTAVEVAGVSADDLQHNHTGRVVRGSTLEFLRNQNRAKPELIVVDPPRAGLGKEICALLGKIAAREIVYVSCDPATLARDLQQLLHFGYSVASMHLVDLFPQTFHMETVTRLKRN